MKKFKNYALLLLVAVMALTTSCGEDYDDTAIKKDISDLQSRVEKLEKWCDTANGQITSLQGLVTTLQNNDYVTGVTPVMEGTVEVGYTISFTKGQPITIKHGTNGTNGATPVIGVKKHTDNLYYWTIQTGSGEAAWMKDAGGKMIPTTGKDGAAGQKPVISVAKDGTRYYWQIDGQWLTDAAGEKVPATGDKGDTGAAGSNGTNGSDGAPGANGDSFFDSVTPDTAKGTVVIRLANGTEFTLPMLSTTVSFDAYTPLKIVATEAETAVVVTLPATLKKADFAAIKADITNVAGTNTAISRAVTEKWEVALTAPTFKTDGTLDAQPTVKVTVPATATQGETALLEVTVVDTKGNKSASTRVLYYYDNGIAWATGNLVADGANGAKVGLPTDGGLYFQFGSLIGWSETGDPTIAVSPTDYTGGTTWNKDWTGDPTTDNATAGTGDPCRYYLGDTWRLPTKDEYVALFKNHGYPSTGPWKWDASSKSATNDGLNLTFPASGFRGLYGGSLSNVGTGGYFWSASPNNASNGCSLNFLSSYLGPSGTNARASGFAVRCVQEQ